MILYYALGFYFYEVLYESLQRIDEVKLKQRNINTFYGGKINFENPNKSKIYYQNDYSTFNKGVKSTVSKIIEQGEKACIIKLDIQDFYGSIKTSSLLEVIDKYSLPSTKKKLSYNESTKEAITCLLLFYNKTHTGLPLSAQNIFSNFISNIYLFELDNFIQNIHRHSDFAYFRYVDDFYLVFNREENTKNDDIGEEIFSITSAISDFVVNTLGLKINHLKSRNWIVGNSEEYNKFIENEKFISFFDPEIKEKPEEQLETVYGIIQKLKNEFEESGKTGIDNQDDIALKEIFINSVKTYIRSKRAKKKLNKAFKGWNPILTLNSVKALMFLIGNSKTGFKRIEKYLQNNFPEKIGSTQNLYLLEKFINLENYKKSLDKDILNCKNRSVHFRLIKRMIKGEKILQKKYLPIKDKILKNHNSLGQQIKMLVLAEEEGKYNLAFNHLLNCFHHLCFISDDEVKVKMKKYDVNSVVNFLMRKQASIEEINFVVSFFDRRNKNNISHPGEI